MEQSGKHPVVCFSCINLCRKITTVEMKETKFTQRELSLCSLFLLWLRGLEERQMVQAQNRVTPNLHHLATSLSSPTALPINLITNSCCAVLVSCKWALTLLCGNLQRSAGSGIIPTTYGPGGDLRGAISLEFNTDKCRKKCD